MDPILKLAGIGCGGRTRTYLEIAANMPWFYQVVAAADPQDERVEMVRAETQWGRRPPTDDPFW